MGKPNKADAAKTEVVLQKAVDDIEGALHEAMKYVPVESKKTKPSNEAWMDVLTERELTIDDEEECSTPEVSQYSTLESEDNSDQKTGKDQEECVTPQQLVIDIDNFDKKYETKSSKQYSEEENTLNIESSEQYPSSVMSTSWTEEDTLADDWEVYMDEENLDVESESVLVPVPTDGPSITVTQVGTYANMVLTGETVISSEPVEEEKKEYIHKQTILHVQDETELGRERSESPVKVDKQGFKEAISKKERYRRKTQSTSLLTEEIQTEIDEALGKDQKSEVDHPDSDIKDIQHNLDSDTEEKELENEQEKTHLKPENRRTKKSRSPKPKKVREFIKIRKEQK